jgi:hypothetical protein
MQRLQAQVRRAVDVEQADQDVDDLVEVLQEIRRQGAWAAPAGSRPREAAR